MRNIRYNILDSACHNNKFTTIDYNFNINKKRSDNFNNK